MLWQVLIEGELKLVEKQPSSNGTEKRN